MRKIIVILLSAFLFACSMNLTSEFDGTKVEKIDNPIRVAILPLEKLDSQSGYIKKIMEVRDLELIFGKSAKFELVDLAQTNEAFLDLGEDLSVEELEPEEIEDLGKELNADIVVTATIEEKRNPWFNMTYNMSSMRTGDVTPSKLVLTKYKNERLTTLDTKFMKELDDFVVGEMTKLTDLAIQNYNVKKYDLAKESFENIIKINPESTEPYYYLGLINLKNEEYDQALARFDYLVAQDTAGTIKYRERQAQTYLMQNKFREATNPMKELAEIENTKERWIELADMYSRANDLNNMEMAVLKALEIDEEDLDTIYRYAIILFDKQAFVDAIPYLEKVNQANPDDDIITDNLVTAYQQSGQIEQAITNYEKIVKKDKNDINSRLNLANMYLAAANEAKKNNKNKTAKSYNKKALATFNKVIKIDNTNGIVYNRLASLYYGEKNYKKAEENAKKARTFSPTNYAPLLIIAQIEQSKGLDKYNEAKKFNREIPKASGSKAETLANKRDEAKNQARDLFTSVEENLNKAMKLTTKPNVIKVIDKRLASLREINERLETSF